MDIWLVRRMMEGAAGQNQLRDRFANRIKARRGLIGASRREGYQANTAVAFGRIANCSKRAPARLRQDLDDKVARG